MEFDVYEICALVCCAYAGVLVWCLCDVTKAHCHSVWARLGRVTCQGCPSGGKRGTLLPLGGPGKPPEPER